MRISGILKRIKSIIPLNFKRAVLLQLHKGDKYICPFCNYGAKDLAPLGFDFKVIKENRIIGAGIRNGRCYGCGSSDRERLVYAFLADELGEMDQLTQKRVLHVAPEPHLSRLLQKMDIGQYVCGDLFMSGYTYPRHVEDMNILDIKYPNEYFDLIICNHVLEHIWDDNSAINELFRVLKKGGRAILQVPISQNLIHTYEDSSIIDPRERERLFGQFDHVRIYGQDYPERLRNGGFEVERLNISSKYHSYGLNSNEELFIGLKDNRIE